MLFKFAQKNPPVDDKDVCALQECFGASLPSELSSYLHESDGGIPDSNHDCLQEMDLPGMDQDITVEYLLSAREMIDKIEALGEFWPKEVLPFADDGNGNYICIGRVEDKNGIFFWDFSTGDFIGPIFGSMAEFSNALGKDPSF